MWFDAIDGHIGELLLTRTDNFNIASTRSRMEGAMITITFEMNDSDASMWFDVTWIRWWLPVIFRWNQHSSANAFFLDRKAMLKMMWNYFYSSHQIDFQIFSSILKASPKLAVLAATPWGSAMNVDHRFRFELCWVPSQALALLVRRCLEINGAVSLWQCGRRVLMEIRISLREPKKKEMYL